MRDILFRGKRKDNGEWVEGAYLHQTLFYGDPTDAHWIIEHGEFHCDFYNSYEVIPETVGQFTGLYDGTKWEELSTEEQALFLYPENGGKRTKEEWKGRPIFEGDVVEATIVRDLGGGKQTKSDIGLVGYDSLGMLGIILHYDDNVPVWSDVLIELSLSCAIEDFCFEVIGNIHDNPELLKGGAK